MPIMLVGVIYANNSYETEKKVEWFGKIFSCHLNTSVVITYAQRILLYKTPKK